MSWTLYTWNGSSWVAGTALPNPWGVNFSKRATSQVEVLADGDEGRVEPSTKSWYSFKLTWGYAAASLKTQLEGYVDNGTIIKITDLMSNTYIVKISSVDSEETNGTITYNISIDARKVKDPS